MNHSLLCHITVAALLMGAAAPAAAQSGGSLTENKLTLAGALGYGFRVTDDGGLDQDANPYGLGIGTQVGYTLRGGLYLGGMFKYFHGESVGGGSVHGRINQVNLVGDVGFDLPLGPRAVLRPLVGLGATVAMGEFCVLGQCDEDRTDPLFLVAPGVQLIIGVGGAYVGGEVRYFFLPDDKIPDGLLFGANVGALL